MNIPVLSRDLVREIDRRAIEEYHIPGMVLMENAGRGCTDVLCELGIDGPVAICCGKGNNAGDGLVIARHLDLRGHAAKVLFWSEPAELVGDAGQNYRIARHAGLPMHTLPSAHEAELARHLEGADWIVDALLGTGARGEPRTPFDAVIDQLNRHPAKKLAVDVPSGFDCETGQPAKHCFRADHTCTFAAAKPGLVAPNAREWVGELHLLDIGIPSQLLKQFCNEA
ncbi:MAG: NAD(P)H-hydrate epimerase [Planctomycetota bacterium]